MYYSGISAIPLHGVLAGLYVGLFEMGITYLFWLLALQHATNTAKVSTLIYCSPFLSLVIINRVLHEPLLATTFTGLLFIVAGIVLQKYYGQRLPSA